MFNLKLLLKFRNNQNIIIQYSSKNQDTNRTIQIPNAIV